MTTEWVDFKKVKEAVDVRMVLDHYGVKGLTKSGDELRGPCPIHKGSRQSKNFTVNERKNAFKCFSRDCGVRGNVLDFVAAMEQCSVRDAGLKLQEWFKMGESESVSSEQGEDMENVAEVQRGIYRDGAGALYELITSASSAEDFESLVVYRELFGDYKFWVALPLKFFGKDEATDQPRFILVKAI